MRVHIGRAVEAERACHEEPREPASLQAFNRFFFSFSFASCTTTHGVPERRTEAENARVSNGLLGFAFLRFCVFASLLPRKYIRVVRYYSFPQRESLIRTSTSRGRDARLPPALMHRCPPSLLCSAQLRLRRHTRAAPSLLSPRPHLLAVHSHLSPQQMADTAHGLQSTWQVVVFFANRNAARSPGCSSQ